MHVITCIKGIDESQNLLSVFSKMHVICFFLALFIYVPLSKHSLKIILAYDVPTNFLCHQTHVLKPHIYGPLHLGLVVLM